MEQTPNMSELWRIAQSPAGQQLLTLLQRSGGSSLQNAVSKASAGDYAEAKDLLSSLLDSPEAQQLLKQLEDTR